MKYKENVLKYLIFTFVLFATGCGGSGNDEVDNATTWNESNWNDKNWE